LTISTKSIYLSLVFQESILNENSGIENCILRSIAKYIRKNRHRHKLITGWYNKTHVSVSRRPTRWTLGFMWKRYRGNRAVSTNPKTFHFRRRIALTRWPPAVILMYPTYVLLLLRRRDVIARFVPKMFEGGSIARGDVERTPNVSAHDCYFRFYRCVFIAYGKAGLTRRQFGNEITVWDSKTSTYERLFTFLSYDYPISATQLSWQFLRRSERVWNKRRQWDWSTVGALLMNHNSSSLLHCYSFVNCIQHNIYIYII